MSLSMLVLLMLLLLLNFSVVVIVDAVAVDAIIACNNIDGELACVPEFGWIQTIREGMVTCLD